MKEVMTRRSFFAASALGSAMAWAENKRLRVGCHTSAWNIQVPEFDNLLRVAEEAKALGYEGFETGYRNVQGQFENLKEARARLQKSGIRFFGCHIFQFDYDPKTNVPAFDLIKRIAEGVSQLDCERLIVSGTPVGADPERLRWKAGAIGRAGRLCRDLRLNRICYHAQASEWGGELNTLLKETDSDTVRFILDGGDAAFFAKHHKRIEGLHIHRGQDYAAIAEAVKKTNWEGWVIAEEKKIGAGKSVMEPARANIRTVFNT